MVISLQATEIFAQQTAEVEQPSMWALEGIHEYIKLGRNYPFHRHQLKDVTIQNAIN